MWARKKVDKKQDVRNDLIRDAIVSQLETDSDREAVEKDVHLIEAALASDQTVFSRDEKARAALKRSAQGLASIRHICWVTPEHDLDELIHWLEEGAPRREEWTLGAGGS